MTVREASEEYLVYIESVRTLSANTVSACKNDLAHFASMPHITWGKDISEITEEELRLCIGQLSLEKKEASSINRFIASLRSLFSYCRRFGYIKNDPSSNLKTIKIPKRLPAFLTGAEVDALCKSPSQKPLLWEKRDRALFELMYSSGCRLSEVSALKLSDFSPGLSSAVVRGKGNKERVVYLENDAVTSLKEYLTERNSRFQDSKVNNPKNFIFVNQKGLPLSSRGISFILSEYSGVKGTNHHVNPHALRHTFATAMISNGADVRLVQEMLGHSSISTTQRYTHVSTQQMIAMYNKAHPHGGNK
ncbi:MAG: tyrosine-type recombinase/integrase [Lachnospiraceae bacterium]|nr:tyrosine-type recombinase/integrase [Lachnospiraceae bacterium]